MKSLPTSIIASLAIATGLTACGGDLVAPENRASNDFLNQVDNRCGKLNIGSQPIDYLLSDDSDDTYFVDETSKLATGEIGPATYTQDLNSFYPAGDNAPAIECVVGLLPPQ